MAETCDESNCSSSDEVADKVLQECSCSAPCHEISYDVKHSSVKWLAKKGLAVLQEMYRDLYGKSYSAHYIEENFAKV